jgi:hypothetical protein
VIDSKGFNRKVTEGAEGEFSLYAFVVDILPVLPSLLHTPVAAFFSFRIAVMIFSSL